ncbi:maleylpyruvate isomerase N-terminal domain-containing protein [Pseudonocardia spinosispora]|uniref:maleylpyruvate isomerase N-terminal domain-containing protein n=1 Tax=Pseudonocardia spinosispora TaxID=103441 RepID=UPI0004035302|nr:maleylpyruvate isomerase N-terminal domain-containing protein [Pseudonocardia spinosispora]
MSSAALSEEVDVSEATELVRLYQETKNRIAGLVSELDESGLGTVVPACPAWSIREVVAHLAAVAEDWTAGRLTGPPDDDETAAQVARFAGRGMAEVMAAWTEAAARLDHQAATAGLNPPIGDIVSHEQDIRGALGRPGARDCVALSYSADQVLTMLRTPVPLRITVDGVQYRSGPAEGAVIGLTTTRFEALRWRTGRRSRAQLAAMDWSGDPAPLLDHLYLFGPATTDVTE